MKSIFRKHRRASVMLICVTLSFISILVCYTLYYYYRFNFLYILMFSCLFIITNVITITKYLDTPNGEKNYELVKNDINSLRERITDTSSNNEHEKEVNCLLTGSDNNNKVKKKNDFDINNLRSDCTTKMDKDVREAMLKFIINENSLKIEKDILELMLENMSEIKKYYLISKSHAQSSFVLSVITCIIGIIILIASIILAFIVKEINMAIIATISGAVTELFAGTALVVHKSSIKQLNHYYQALHENEQFLSIVNLVSKVSKEKQDDVYINIITNSLEILKSTATKEPNKL